MSTKHHPPFTKEQESGLRISMLRAVKEYIPSALCMPETDPHEAYCPWWEDGTTGESWHGQEEIDQYAAEVRAGLEEVIDAWIESERGVTAP